MNERRYTGAKLNPTLFDKLITSSRTLEQIGGGRSDLVSLDPGTTQLRLGPAPVIDRFNEAALRNTVRRELNWLLNTTRLEAVQDLDAYPQVKTSVLNYGMPDLTGRSSTKDTIDVRAREIRDAVITFEPRIDQANIQVESRSTASRANAVSYLIRGDITSAVKAMPVQFVADVETDSGAVLVRD